MSEREKIQNDLVEYLQEKNFNAPYGILTALRAVGKHGFVREITFGLPRTLDCVVTIWSPKKITVKAWGPHSRCIAQNYKSLDELKVDLDVIT